MGDRRAYFHSMFANKPNTTAGRAAMSSSRSINNCRTPASPGDPRTRRSAPPGRSPADPAIDGGERPPRPDDALVVRRVGSAELFYSTSQPSGGGRGNLGKDLCRRVRSRAHDEAVAVTSGTEASPTAGIRMDGIGVPAARAEDHQVGVARWRERDGLRHCV